MLLNEKKTLAQRLAEGRLPVLEALRYAVQLADALRRLHDAGGVHGAIMPVTLGLTAAGIEFLPAPEGSARIITPYSAPEVVLGRPADARSDVFAFGAVLFEMFTGRRAFDGETRTALVTSITKAPVPPSGSPGVDRLLRKCLAKSPDLRTPRMQKVIMELKLLSVAVRRVDAASGAAVPRSTAIDPAAPRPEGSGVVEMHQLESRLAARLQLHERTIAEMHRAANEAVSSLRLQVAAINSELAANLQMGSVSHGLDDGSSGPIQDRLDRGFEVLNQRMTQMERSIEEMRCHVSEFEHNMAADLVDIEQNLKSQSTAVESTRTAMSQTDDLVERVVEALESLQTAMLDQDDNGGGSGLSVN